MKLDFNILPKKRLEAVSFIDLTNKFKILYGNTTVDENGNWIYINGGPKIYSSFIDLNESYKINFAWVYSDFFLSFYFNEISNEFTKDFLYSHPKRNVGGNEIDKLSAEWDKVGFSINLSTGSSILKEDVKAYFCLTLAVCSFVDGVILAEDGGWNNTDVLEYGYYLPTELMSKISV